MFFVAYYLNSESYLLFCFSFSMDCFQNFVSFRFVLCDSLYCNVLFALVKVIMILRGKVVLGQIILKVYIYTVGLYLFSYS